jgi:pilus assembly protein CpaF
MSALSDKWWSNSSEHQSANPVLTSNTPALSKLYPEEITTHLNTPINQSLNQFQSHPINPQNSAKSQDLYPSQPRLTMDFGPIHHLMIDPTIEEIWINSPHKIFISRNGRTELTTVFLSHELIENIVERALMWGGRRLDRSHPFVDARLPDGSRLHVAIPDVTAEHWAINIRKHLMHGKSLKDLSDMGVFPKEVEELLAGAVRERKNILVSGSTQAGKTTLINALIGEIPQYERVITIEEVFEIRSVLPDVVALQTRSASLEGTGEIGLRDLIKESLRMRPSRLVVGEIREAESLDLLIALNSGVPGMATIHGNSARDAIRKLQTLPLLAGENISHKFISPTVARSIDWVVHVSIDPKSGKRELQEILEVTGRIEGEALEMEVIYQVKEFDGKRVK